MEAPYEYNNLWILRSPFRNDDVFSYRNPEFHNSHTLSVSSTTSQDCSEPVPRPDNDNVENRNKTLIQRTLWICIGIYLSVLFWDGVRNCSFNMLINIFLVLIPLSIIICMLRNNVPAQTDDITADSQRQELADAANSIRSPTLEDKPPEYEAPPPYELAVLSVNQLVPSVPPTYVPEQPLSSDDGSRPVFSNLQTYNHGVYFSNMCPVHHSSERHINHNSLSVHPLSYQDIV